MHFLNIKYKLSHQNELISFCCFFIFLLPPSMASTADSDEKPNQQEESIIPVLTVFKNKSIIKNICIVLNNSDGDHIILIGRHPTCNIVLTHPSISRFHLQIRFTPSSRSISLLDVSSGISNLRFFFHFFHYFIVSWNLNGLLLFVVTVHGTWVSGRKLERGVSVELKGGDSFRLGVSSRIYLLRFVSQFDANALKVPYLFQFYVHFDVLHCFFYFLFYIFVSFNCSFLLSFFNQFWVQFEICELHLHLGGFQKWLRRSQQWLRWSPCEITSICSIT